MSQGIWGCSGNKCVDITAPVSLAAVSSLRPRDLITVSGSILCCRDAALARIVAMVDDDSFADLGIDLEGQVIFHSALSPAGVGPTSSNKLEIESSIEPLSSIGVRLFLGKGKLGEETVAALGRHGAAYAIVPPVTALLNSRTQESRVLVFPELGMEAVHLLRVEGYPAIVGAVHGESIYE